MVAVVGGNSIGQSSLMVSLVVVLSMVVVMVWWFGMVSSV